ncbi:hypothetical protein [Actinotalea sp. K2]|uniref:hypothetical protein n=1 Tax=Actinotalea sp. K2 TaxID=2939438 RepID=UPI002017C08C|nr:hypothetical protein [Actinotalea sp. K2]MCL3862369.1 hypothetical protein [Actinotalea sp. K2]
MPSDLVQTVGRLADSYRFALVEAEVRTDISGTERAVLRALVAESAADLDLWLVGQGPAGAEARTALVGVVGALQGAPADDLAMVRSTLVSRAHRAVIGVVDRGIAPAWLGVLTGLVITVLVWVQEPGEARGDRMVGLGALGGCALALVLLRGAQVSRSLVAELGSTTGSLLTRAGSVGAHVERLFDATIGPALRQLGPLGHTPPSRRALALIRRAARVRVVHVYAVSGALTVVGGLGVMRAFGLL